MNDLGLTLFDHLCAVGNALEAYRDTHAPASDAWTALTCILGLLDESIDLLVRSDGIDDEEDDL